MADPFAPYPQPGRGFTTFNPNVTPTRENNWGFGFGLPAANVPGAPLQPPGIPGAINPLPSYGGSLAAGSIPRVPRLGRSTQQAINQNLANLPQLTNLAGQVNAFNLGQVTNQYEQGIPGYQGLAAQSAANISSALRGELPPDVRNLILTNAAEYGLGSGVGGGLGAGGTLTGNSALRSLGLTSLGRQDTGEQLLSGAVARMPRTALFDPASQFITPQQQQNAAFQAAVLASLPDPEAAYQRSRADAAAGLATGFGMGRYNTGGGGGGGAPSSNLQSIMDMLNRYQGGIAPPGQGAGNSYVPPAAAPPAPVNTTGLPSGTGWSASYIPGQGQTGFGTWGLPPQTPSWGTPLPASSSNQYDWFYGGA